MNIERYDGGEDSYSSRGYSVHRTTGAYKINRFEDGLEYEGDKEMAYKPIRNNGKSSAVNFGR